MTPEAQRIAIAEACGWVRVRAHWEKGEDSAYCNDSNNHRQLPDYLNDLNVMHEAENALEYAHRAKYAEVLYREVLTKCSIDTWSEGEHDFDGYFDLLRATAAQRAEAFLRTLNLWKD